MAYSSIVRKGCKCGCGKYPTLGYKGFNADCRPDLKAAAIKKQKDRNALRSDLAHVRKLAVEVDGVKAPKEYQELDIWFKDRMGRLEIKCDNCGATNWWLEQNKDTKIGKLKWRSCQAHLLQKRHFKSIMTHPLNGMVMGSGYSGLCHCHDTYDSSWDKASKMNIWDEVVRRFKIMYPLIQPNEQQYIPDVLLQEINQI
jgi:hypothetical protein